MSKNKAVNGSVHFVELADYKAPQISENKREEWVDLAMTTTTINF